MNFKMVSSMLCDTYLNLKREEVKVEKEVEEEEKEVGHFKGRLSLVGSWSLIALVVHEEPTSQGHCTQGEKVLESLSSNAHPH